MNDLTEEQPPAVVDSDTENKTQIRPDEAPPDRREKFRRFRAYNTGLWNGPKRENKEARHRQDDLHRYDAISSSLDLTDRQQQIGRRILESIDIESFTVRSGDCESVDNVIFGICVLVANADVDDGSRYYPSANSSSNDELFAEIATDLGISTNAQVSIIERLRSEVNL